MTLTEFINSIRSKREAGWSIPDRPERSVLAEPPATKRQSTLEEFVQGIKRIPGETAGSVLGTAGWLSGSSDLMDASRRAREKAAREYPSTVPSMGTMEEVGNVLSEDPSRIIDFAAANAPQVVSSMAIPVGAGMAFAKPAARGVSAVASLLSKGGKARNIIAGLGPKAIGQSAAALAGTTAIEGGGIAESAYQKTGVVPGIMETLPGATFAGILEAATPIKVMGKLMARGVQKGARVVGKETIGAIVRDFAVDAGLEGETEYLQNLTEEATEKNVTGMSAGDAISSTLSDPDAHARAGMAGVAGVAGGGGMSSFSTVPRLMDLQQAAQRAKAKASVPAAPPPTPAVTPPPPTGTATTTPQRPPPAGAPSVPVPTAQAATASPVAPAFQKVDAQLLRDKMKAVGLTEEKLGIAGRLEDQTPEDLEALDKSVTEMIARGDLIEDEPAALPTQPPPAGPEMLDRLRQARSVLEGRPPSPVGPQAAPDASVINRVAQTRALLENQPVPTIPPSMAMVPGAKVPEVISPPRPPSNVDRVRYDLGKIPPAPPPAGAVPPGPPAVPPPAPVVPPQAPIVPPTPPSVPPAPPSVDAGEITPQSKEEVGPALQAGKTIRFGGTTFSLARTKKNGFVVQERSDDVPGIVTTLGGDPRGGGYSFDQAVSRVLRAWRDPPEKPLAPGAIPGQILTPSGKPTEGTNGQQPPQPVGQAPIGPGMPPAAPSLPPQASTPAVVKPAVPAPGPVAPEGLPQGGPVATPVQPPPEGTGVRGQPGGKPPTPLPPTGMPHGTAGETTGNDTVPGPGTEGDRAPGGRPSGVPESSGEPVAPTAPAEPEQVGKPGGVNIPALSRALVPFIERSVSEKRKMDNPALEEAAAQAMGMTRKDLIADPQYSKKIVQESFESALVQHIRKNNITDVATLTDLYNNQPNLNQRTGTSVTNQAYSTPVNLVGMLTQALHVRPTDTVLEPTAGTGLLVSAMPNRDGKGMVLNELDPLRLTLLRDAFPGARVTDQDATQPFSGRQVSVVVANPPFGQLDKPVTVRTQKGVDREFPIAKLEHLIAWRALEKMKDNGVAVLIFGAEKDPGIHGSNKSFMAALYNQFNVKGHFEVEGKLYSRQGAAWPITVLVIQGRRDFKAGNEIVPPALVHRLPTWDAVQFETDKIGKEINRAEKTAEPEPGDRGGGVPPVGPTGQSGVPGGIPGSPGGSPGPSGQAVEPAGGGKGGRGKPGTRPGRGSGASGETRPGGAVSPEPAQAPAGSESVSEPVPAPAKQPSEPEGGREGEPEPGTGSRPVDAGGTRAVTPPKEDKRTDLQTTYKEKSKARSGNNLIPVNLENPIREALENLEKTEGKTVDDFVAGELGVSTTTLHSFLDGVQVDAVGLAIQAVKQNMAIVNADQTGVGKGRTAAAMVFWAKKNGQIPMFMTEKAGLFSDMYRDMKATMGTKLRPFILNANGVVTDKDESGKTVWSPPSPAERDRVLNNMKAGDMSDFGPDGKYDFVMSTYSQVALKEEGDEAGKTVSPGKVLKIDALTRGKNFFPILDEAHNASGSASGTGDNVKKILDNAKGAYYLSATWAKRPDSMGIFFKAIGVDPENLESSLARGGVGMQELLVATMAASGRYLRREQDFSNVQWVMNRADPKAEAEDARIAEESLKAVRAIINFGASVTGFLEDPDNIDELSDVLPEGTNLDTDAKNDIAQSAGKVDEFSTIHNFIEQLLAASKVKRTVSRVIEMVKAGQKPVIALRSTMESKMNEIEPGDLGEFNGTYKDLLRIMLKKAASVTSTDPMNPRKKITTRIPFDQMPAAMKAAFTAANQEIEEADIPDSLPFSPIDYIENELRKAGYNFGEITGRGTMLDYSSGKPKLRARSGTETAPKQKNAILKRFNDGEDDILIINESGATGLSAHSSVDAKDQRQRTMVIIQPLLDINKFMQILGRIHRKGSVTSQDKATHFIRGKPQKYGHAYYEYIQSGMEMELRPASVLQNKMKSLNAQTSSNQKGHQNVSTVDFFNKYGDEIAREWIRNNREVGVFIQAFEENDSGVITDDIRDTVDADWIARRVSVMSVAIQKQFWAEVPKQYTDHIEYLDAVNQNDLKPMSMKESAATTTRRIELPLPREGTNPPVVLEENVVTVKGTPRTLADAKKDTTPVNLERFGEAEEEEREFLDGLAKDNAARIKKGEDPRWDIPAITRNNKLQKTRLVEQFRPGTRIYYQMDENTTIPAVVTYGVVERSSAGGNPFTNGKIRFTLATPMPFGSIKVSLSEMGSASTLTESQKDDFEDEWNKFYADSKTKRVPMSFLTGDVVRAAGVYPGRARVVQFQRSDKTLDYGWMMPAGFSPSELTTPPIELDADGVLERINSAGEPEVMSSDRGVKFGSVVGHKMEITASKRSKSGSAILADKELPRIMGKTEQDDYFPEKSRGSKKVFSEVISQGSKAWPAIFARIKEILARFGARITRPGDKILKDDDLSDRTGAVSGRGFRSDPVAKWARRGMAAAFDLAGQIVAMGKSLASFVSELTARGMATVRKWAADLWKDAQKLIPPGMRPRRGAIISVEAAKKAWAEAKKGRLFEKSEAGAVAYQEGFKGGSEMVSKVAREAIGYMTMKAMRETLSQAKTLDRAVKDSLIEHASKMGKDIRSRFLARIARATNPDAGIAIITDMEIAKLEAKRRRSYVGLRMALRKLKPKTLRPEYREMAADLSKRIEEAKDLDKANKTNQLRKFNYLELDELTDEAELIRYANDTDNKVIFGKQLKDAVEVGKEIYDHLQTEPAISDAPTGKDEKGFFNWFFDEGSMNFEALTERMGKAGLDVFYDRLNDGYRKATGLWHEGRDSAVEAMKTAGHETGSLATAKWAGEVVEVPTTTRTGPGTAKMSRAHKLNLVATVMDASSRKEVIKAGIKTDKNANELMKFTEANLKEIEDSLSAGEKAIIKAMREFVNGKLKAEVNKTWVLLSGSERAFRSDYWPRVRERIETGMNKWQTAWTKKHPLLEGLGIFKDRTGGKNPLIIGDLFQVFNQHSKKATTFAGMAVPIRNARVVLGAGGVEKAANNRFGVQFAKRINDQLDALQDMGSKEGGELNRGLSNLLRNIGGSVLGLNLRSMLKQFGGLLTQATEFGVEDMLAGLKGIVGGKKLQDQIFKYSPKLRERYDSSGARLVMPVFGGEGSLISGQVTAAGHYLNRTQEISLMGLEKFDQFIIQSIWKSSESQVKWENPDLEGDAFWEKVADRAEQVVARTQNTTSVIDMSGVALESRKSATWKAMTAFQSQGNAIYNIMRRAVYQYGRGEIGAGEMVRRIVLGNIGNALLVTLVGALFGGGGEEPEESRKKRGVGPRKIGKVLAGVIKEQFGTVYLTGPMSGGVQKLIDIINEEKTAGLPARGMENVVESTINNAVRGVADIDSAVVKWGERFKTGKRAGQEMGPAYLKSGAVRGLEALMALYGLPRFPIRFIPEMIGKNDGGSR